MGSNTDRDLHHTLRLAPTNTHLFLSLCKVVASLNLSHYDDLSCAVWLAE